MARPGKRVIAHGGEDRVGREPVGLARRVRDDLARERMCEDVAGQEADRPRRHEIGLGQAGVRQRLCHDHTRAGFGQRLQEQRTAGRRREPLDTVDEGALEGGGGVDGVVQGTVSTGRRLHRSGQTKQCKRVAASCREHPLGTCRVECCAVRCRLEDGPGCGRVEWADRYMRPAAPQPLVVARRGDKRHPMARGAAREIRQRFPRRFVDPVDVIDEDGNGAVIGADCCRGSLVDNEPIEQTVLAERAADDVRGRPVELTEQCGESRERCVGGRS